MAIETNEIKRVFRYNGIELPDIPGHAPRDVRNLYSAQYPELISAEIEDGGLQNGVHVYTFRKAVGTKGGQKQEALKAAVAAELTGQRVSGGAEILPRITGRMAQRARAWHDFVGYCTPDKLSLRPCSMPDSHLLTPVA